MLSLDVTKFRYQVQFLISDIKFETISEIRKKDYLNLKAKCFEQSKKFDSNHSVIRFILSHIFLKEFSDKRVAFKRLAFLSYCEALT